MPKVIIGFPEFDEVYMHRAPKDFVEEDLMDYEVFVDIPSGFYNDYERVTRRLTDHNKKLSEIWKHAKQVGNGRRYG